MTYLAALLHRELPSVAARAHPSPSRTTAGPGVVPRLASRFEDSSAPEWGSAAGIEAGAVEPEQSGVPARVGKATELAPAGQTLPNPARMVPEPAGARQGTVNHPRRPERREEPAGAMRPSTGHRFSPSVPERDALLRPAENPPTLAMKAPPIFTAADKLEPASPAPRLPDAGGERRHPVRRSGVVHEQAVQQHVGGRKGAQAAHQGSVRPRLEPLPPREQAVAPEPRIMVSIGRIEVKALHTAAPAPQHRERAGLMSLDEYEEGRS